MKLDQALHRLAENGHVTPRGLDDIERRAQGLRRRSRLQGTALAAAVLALSSWGVMRTWDATRSGPKTKEQGRLAPAAGSSASPTSSLTPLCERVDACADQDEKLSGDEEWLGARLTGAGLEYRNAFRPDGGGGHVNLRWGFQVWVLRPTEDTPELEAARWEYRPLWSSAGVTVYGSARPDSPVAYFYWRAGGVDTFVEVDWKSSAANNTDELQRVFADVIAEQEQHPYRSRG